MPPESQTLFSVTLFLALSSLLAWSNRRHRRALPVDGPALIALVRGDHSVRPL
jgi:hypothetical protein